MNNLSLYCGLTDWRMSASDAHLHVKTSRILIVLTKKQHCPFCMKNLYVILQLILLIKATFTGTYHTFKDFCEL